MVEEIIGRLPKLTESQLGRLEDEIRRERQRRASFARGNRTLPLRGGIIASNALINHIFYRLMHAQLSQHITFDLITHLVKLATSLPSRLKNDRF